MDERLIDHDSSAISFAHQFIVLAYNSSIVAPQDRPPRAGKTFSTPNGRAGWACPRPPTTSGAWLWGAGAKKKPPLRKSPGAAESRRRRAGPHLYLGEIYVALSLTDSYIHIVKQTGAPVAEADVQLVVAPSYHVGVLKGAPHPHTAHLFAVFMTAPESQRIWEKTVGVSSALIPGTAYFQKAQGKQMIYMSKDNAQKVDQLSKKYGSMLGLR